MTAIILWFVAAYWGMPLLVSILFIGWLRFVSHDIKFEGIIWLWRFLPVFRFRLISRKSWYARAWEYWYGQAMFLAIIHRDEKGGYDDETVLDVIVHELRHVAQFMVFGTLHWVIYGLDYVRLWSLGANPYRANVFERDARQAVKDWDAAGRPPIYDFGRRQ